MRGPILAARTTAVGDRKFVILDNFGKDYNLVTISEKIPSIFAAIGH